MSIVIWFHVNEYNTELQLIGIKYFLKKTVDGDNYSKLYMRSTATSCSLVNTEKRTILFIF